MSYSPMLFSTKGLPSNVVLSDYSVNNGEPFEFPNFFHDRTKFKNPMDKWALPLFEDVREKLPPFFWVFSIPSYSKSFKKINDPDNVRAKRALARIFVFLKEMIRTTGARLLFCDLNVDFAFRSPEDMKIVEVNLNDYDFSPGKEPEEFRLDDSSVFYEFVMR